MELVKEHFGENAITHRLFGTIDDIDVELHIILSCLDVSLGDWPP